VVRVVLCILTLLVLFPGAASAQRLSREWLGAKSPVFARPTAPAKHGHAVRGLVVGAAAGFVVGAILFSPNSNACTGSGNYGEHCLLYRAGIVVGGAGLGALVGSLIRTEKQH
jgi:hypothetical protein